MSNIPGIYKIDNKVTEDFYIGSAINMDRRFSNHRHALQNQKHSNYRLQNVYNKYGLNNLSFEIVEHVPDKNKLIEREQYYMDTLNPKYNIRKIANSNLGLKCSEETKLKMSEANSGKKQSKKQILTKSKPFKLLSPQGLVIEGINLTKFCRENNLDQSHMCRVASEKSLSHKGWRKI